MMKLTLFFLIILLYGCEKQTIVVNGNIEKIPLKFDFKTTKDADCGMTVERLKFSGQVISQNGKTWFFHDPGSIPRFLNKTKVVDPVIWFYTVDTKKWVKAENVWFSLNDETPMEYGFGAYETRKENYINYETMRLKMLRGENLTNPKIRKLILGNS